MLTSIVAAVVILGLLIIVHEAGHFLVAKRLGVRVLRFSIGYPPRILGFRRGETEYVIGATPFGGYVRMLGDEVSEDPKTDELSNFLLEICHDLAQLARESEAMQRVFADSASPQAVAVGQNTSPSYGVGNPNSSDEDRLLECFALHQETAPRPLKPEEVLLLNRIRLNSSAETARKTLQENPPEELMAAFRARAFPTQSLWKRFAIVLAGPASNILFAPLLLAIVFMYGVPVALPVVGKAMAGSPAEKAGLLPGDKIVGVNGKTTATWNDFSDAVKASQGAPLSLTVQRSMPGASSRRP